MTNQERNNLVEERKKAGEKFDVNIKMDQGTTCSNALTGLGPCAAHDFRNYSWAVDDFFNRI